MKKNQNTAIIIGISVVLVGLASFIVYLTLAATGIITFNPKSILATKEHTPSPTTSESLSGTPTTMPDSATLFATPTTILDNSSPSITPTTIVDVLSPSATPSTILGPMVQSATPTTAQDAVFPSATQATLHESKGLMSWYDITFSTYIGGSQFEHGRDVFVDDQGFVYVAGGSASPEYPITTGPGFNNNACQSLGSGGKMDVSISKFTPGGQLVWSRLLGGPCYDRAYAVEVDQYGYVYVAGRAGEGFPVTAGVFQPNFNGSSASQNNFYGAQNGFAAKISPDGENVIWASHVGVTEAVRDFAIDDTGNLYFNSGNPNKGDSPPSAWYVNAFQSTPQGGIDNGVMKVTNDGQTVIWATWLGGPGDESSAGSIRVDDQGYVYAAGCTYASGFPTDPKTGVNPDVFDRTHHGGADGFVAKLTPDGSDLVYGTYIGGSADDFLCNTHNLAVDDQGNAYISSHTASIDFPTTNGAFDTTHAAGGDVAIIKFSPTGALLASTFIGGNDSENPDGIYVSPEGNVYFTGETSSTDFPTVNPLWVADINFDGSYNHGSNDAFVTILSADFSQLLFSSYLGGAADDRGRSGFLGSDGSLYVTGSSEAGPGFPLKNEYQDYAGSVDIILVKLAPTSAPPTATPTSLSTDTPTPAFTSTPTNAPTLTAVPTDPAQPSVTLVASATPAPTAFPLITPVPAPVPAPVFLGEYFDNKNLKGEPDLVRYDNGILFDWGKKAPDQSLPKDRFSVRWTSEVTFDGGIYTFSVWSDDGLRVYIDDQLVHDEWHRQKADLQQFDLTIQDGLHTVRVEFFEYKGSAEVGVVWVKK